MTRTHLHRFVVIAAIAVVFLAGTMHHVFQDVAGAGGEDDIFGPVGSGFWYPADEKDLKNMIDSFLADTHVQGVEGRILAVIAPHAGLPWAGPCAAFSFKPLIRQKIERVIILAPSHLGGFRGVSVLLADYYRTPLGLIKIDVDACKGLMRERLFDILPWTYTREHSLENMLPFLQRTLSQFKLVPLIVGDLSHDDYDVLARSIRRYHDKRTLIVVSSDFTHYGPHHDYVPVPFDKDTRRNIEKLDRGAIDRIVNVDFSGFQRYVSETGVTICGMKPIALLLKIMPKGVKGKLAHYYMSGDLTGDYQNSVSYAAILFYE